MNSAKLKIVFVCLAGAVGLMACVATPPAPPIASPSATQASQPPDLAATYAELLKSGGKVIPLDPKTSDVRILVFRGGRAGTAGHNHVLSAPQFTGFFHLPSSGANNARFDLAFRLDQLEIDNAALRATLGGAFSAVMPPEFIEGTRRHMLGEDNMQAAQFPFVRIRSLEIQGEAPRFAAKVEIEMHGQKREMWLPLTVEGLPERLSVTGSFVLRQTDFGVTPYSILGGLVTVKDEVIIEFTLRGA